jgi:GNAT superfamily N-acetyltransferase
MEIDPADIRVRVATSADADTFSDQRIALLESLGSEAQAADLVRLRGETHTAFLEALALDACTVWLAENAAGAVVGSAALVCVLRFPSLQNPSRREGYLAHMFVQPALRRRGIGTALLRAALEETRRRGLVRLRLHSTEEGRRLYDAFGFKLRANDMEIYVEGHASR